MRLHLNENTAGCSPAVLETLRAPRPAGRGLLSGLRRRPARPSPGASACRPTTSCSRTASTRASSPPSAPRSAIAPAACPKRVGVAPAFDMYEVCTTALGGRMVTVPLDDGFELDAAAIARGRHAARRGSSSSPTRTTRAAFDAARRRCASSRATSRRSMLFVDEAYADFSGEIADRRRHVRAAAEPGRRADVLEGLRPRGAARRRRDRRARRPSRRSRASSRPTA